MNLHALKTSAANFWDIIGDFGKFDPEIHTVGSCIFAKNESIEVTSETEKHENGVCVQRGMVKNISGKEVTLNVLSSVFTLDGGEYEVYSQYNGWENESQGAWQPLATGFFASSESVRNAHSAAPFSVLWNRQCQRGTAFHLSAYSNWKISIARKYYKGESTYIEVKLGISDSGLAVKLAPGEELLLPEIIYYDVLNRVDLDCWKLHAYLNKKYPRREMPVIYNTWLYKFDRFTYDDIIKQIERAQMLGVEYFVTDAGWFGNGENWSEARGDWEENAEFGFRGRMLEAAEQVRAHGMKFGFWLEPECASDKSDIVKEHPEYFLKGDSDYFVDFSNPAAVEYIFNKTCSLVERFGAKFIKFDFNADLNYDVYKSGFTRYFKGHKKYIKMLKERYPDLYIENCASGGMRMSVRDGTMYDSFWLSDNQSPYHTLRIFKDTILRMPPQWVECWATVTSAEDIAPVYGSSEMSGKLIASNDATWDDVRGVRMSYLTGVLTGSPVGLSCDLTAISDSAFGELRKFIAEFKKKRSFWKNAVCHILTDTDSMLVLEFRNEDFSEIELVVFTKKLVQENIRVYPVCNADYWYSSCKSGSELSGEGIDFRISESASAQRFSLVSEKK